MRFIICYFWRLKVQCKFPWVEIIVSTGLCPSDGSRGESVSMLLPAFRVASLIFLDLQLLPS